MTDDQKPQSDWRAGLVMPNVYMNEAVEAGLVAFAPIADPRVQQIFAADMNFAEFMGRFTDAFNTTLTPLVLIVHKDIPAQALSMSMATGLRDCLSASVVPGAYARQIIWDRSLEFGFSDAFDFYPWVPSLVDDGGMTLFTPALRGALNFSPG